MAVDINGLEEQCKLKESEEDYEDDAENEDDDLEDLLIKAVTVLQKHSVLLEYLSDEHRCPKLTIRERRAIDKVLEEIDSVVEEYEEIYGE